MISSNTHYMFGTTTHLPITMERRERPLDPIPKPPGPKDDDAGPRQPEPGSPSRDNLLKRMRKVDPKQAERYRQRTGE
jgi:Prokaryotic ubiquitin-like protein UBact